MPENTVGLWKRLFEAMRNSLGCILDLLPPQECAKMRASHVAPRCRRICHAPLTVCQTDAVVFRVQCRLDDLSLPRLWASPERDCYQEWDPPLNLNRDSIFGSIKFTGQDAAVSLQAP